MSTATGTRTDNLALLRGDLDRFAVYAAASLFTLVAVASRTGAIVVPGGLVTLALFPFALLALDAFWPQRALRTEVHGAAAWAGLVLLALVLTPSLTQSVAVAVGLPVAIAVGVLVSRTPAVAVPVTVALTASLGSFEAFLGFGPGVIIELLLAGLWLAVIGRVVLGRPDEYVIWPAVLGFLLFAGISVVDLLTSDEFVVAYLGFKATVWYMLALLAIAYAGWSRETYRRMALGLVIVCFIACSYVVFRWIMGHSSAELELAKAAGAGINVEPYTEDVRVIGSFQTAHAMSFWTAFMGPFCLAVAVWVTGRWRALAISAAILCLTAILASEIRGPLPGFVGGSMLVLVLHQISRAFPGFGRGTATAVILAVLGLSGGLVALSASDPERVDRFEAVLDPSSDPAFAVRQPKWEQVLDSAEKNPFGRGLGTAGAGQVTSGATVELAQFNVDSSYLKVAYEQGLLVMALFIATVVGLLVSLVVASLRTRSKEAAALGLGASGALLSILVSFYTGNYIESTPIIGAWILVGLGMSYFVAKPKAGQPREA